ncbi:MAG TPA: efflux RND transporter permease subunit [Burkholderiaceae bacterium]|nr:efflux RND transporter permease subunit [Burkholderiaceae bacterium]
MFFTRISINNPWLATMLMLAFVVLGLFSYQRLQVDQFPDVTFPVVVIQTDYPGAAPESVESEITRKIEEAVNTVSGLRALSSRSYAGTSLVVAEFELTVDPVQAAQDVREKVAAIRADFRREIKEPKITRFDPADRPIISFAVTSTGTRSLRELTTLADQIIKKRLENVRGVGQVNLVGGVKREVQIYLKPAQLEALAIGVDQVINAIRTENQELPLGALRSAEQERVVQIQARAVAPEDFNRIVITRRGGQPIYLSQIATVVDGEQERESAALIDDRETLALDVLKASGQNTIEVSEAVSRAAQAVQREMPPDVKITVVKDAAIPIRTAVRNVTRTMIEGALLTVLIVFLFLGSWRSTVITGLTLPIATIGTFLVMYAFGFTLNMLTLMALSLCIGLLIDDAIVVRENIVRHGAMGKSHRMAALDGTQEIGLAVLATTLSIVAVFLPVGFMGGIIGRFFHQFGVTVVAAVLISMFVSFTLDPMLSSVWPDPAVHSVRPRGPLGWLLGRFERLTNWLGDVYQALLAWSLRHRMATLAIALLAFFGSFLLVPLLGTEFVPQADFSETQVNFRTPEGTSLEATAAKARQVQAALHEFPEVSYTYATINTGAVQSKNIATVYVKLKPRAQRKRNQAELTQPLRERLGRIAGITVTHVGVMNPVSQQKLLVVSLQGQDLKQLERQSEEAMRRLAQIPGLVDLDSSSRPARPTLDLMIDRDRAGDLGLGVDRIGAALRPLLAGEAASAWRDSSDESYDVTVRLAPGERTTTGDLERLSLTATTIGADGMPRLVPLRQVVELRPGVGAAQINRRDLSREVELTANVYGRASGQVSADIERTLRSMDWQPGYRFVMGGSTKDMAESFGFAASALLLAIIFIYMILGSQFMSFLQPLAIMSSLPMTLIGVFLALLLFRSTLNIFSIIGFIMLMGLVTKNAILLVDFAQQARKGFEGAAPLERAQALLLAARVRLRPILMTTLAMVFGMVPLALGLTEGSEQRAPMGQAVIGGIITSSLLTLVVVPVIYTYLDDLARWTRGRKSGAALLDGAPSAPRED